MFRRAFRQSKVHPQRFSGIKWRHSSIRKKSTREKDEDPYTSMFSNKTIEKKPMASLKPANTNPNNLTPAQLRREVAIRKTALFGKKHYWKIMAGCFAGTIGTLGVLLIFDDARIKFKKWAPQGGLVVEHFGELIFGMQFERAQMLQAGTLIPLKYEKPAKALDVTKTLKEQSANFFENSGDAPLKADTLISGQDMSANLESRDTAGTDQRSQEEVPEAAGFVSQEAPPVSDPDQHQFSASSNSESDGVPLAAVCDSSEASDGATLVLDDDILPADNQLPSTPPPAGQTETLIPPEENLEELQNRFEKLSEYLRILKYEESVLSEVSGHAITSIQEHQPEDVVKEIPKKNKLAVPVVPDPKLLEAESRLKYLREQLELMETIKEAKVKAEISKLTKKMKNLKQQLESRNAVVKDLRNKLEKSKEDASIMKMNLDEREAYLRDKIQMIKEGRDLYNETVAAYAELKDEMKEENSKILAKMNQSSRQRIKKLDILDTEIRAIEKIINWHGRNKTYNRKAVLMSLGLMELEKHIKNGSSFNRELQFIELSCEKGSVIDAACSAVPEKLRLSGVPTKSQLISKWDQMEKSVRQAALTPHPLNSLWGSIVAKVFSFFLLRERTNQKGDDPQARISRVGYFLEEGDLRSAVDEVMALEGLPKVVIADWLILAKNRLLASEVLGIIRADLVRRHMEP